jgi:hypothetical protein
MRASIAHHIATSTFRRGLARHGTKKKYHPTTAQKIAAYGAYRALKKDL